MKNKIKMLCLMSFFAVVCVCFATDNKAFEEGKHYRRLSGVMEEPFVKTLRQEHPEKIFVFDFFSYGCGWCYKLAPQLMNWEKQLSAEVVLQEIPVGFKAEWENLARAYYAIAHLEKLPKAHLALFEAVQEETLTSASLSAMKPFFEKEGISAEELEAAFDSSDVLRKQKWAASAARAYRITAIPAFVVQTKEAAFLTSITLAGDESTLFEVLDFLISQPAALAAIP